MLRDIVLSVTGHAILCGTLIYASVTTAKTPSYKIVYNVNPVSLREIEP